MKTKKLARQLANACANFEELQRVGREGRKGMKTRERGGEKTQHPDSPYRRTIWSWEKNLSNIKNSKRQLTIQHRTQNISKHLLASHINKRKTTCRRGMGVAQRVAMSGSQPVTQFTGCHRDTTAGCHREVLDWVQVGVNNHQGPHVQRLAWISYWNMACAQTKMPSNIQKYPDVSMCAHAWIQAHFFCTS